MMTWTCNTFIGHYPTGSALVVSADNIEVAKELVREELKNRGLEQDIKNTQLIPFPTHHRYVRILHDGDY